MYVHTSTVLCAPSVVVISRVRSLKFVYVSSGSRDLAGQAFLFLYCFFFLCSSNFSRIFSYLSAWQRTEKGRPVKEAKKREGLETDHVRHSLLQCLDFAMRIIREHLKIDVWFLNLVLILPSCLIWPDTDLAKSIYTINTVFAWISRTPRLTHALE